MFIKTLIYIQFLKIILIRVYNLKNKYKLYNININILNTKMRVY